MREQRFINIYKQFDISLTSKHVINEINQNLICDGLEIKQDQEKGERLREARGREGRKEGEKKGRKEGRKRKINSRMISETNVKHKTIRKRKF